MSAEFGGVLVGDDLHLLHRLEGEAARAELWRALQCQPLRVVVGAVHIGAEVPHLAAPHVDGVGAGPAGDNIRIERQQPHVVAFLDGQRLELRPIDRGGDFGRGRLHDGRVPGDVTVSCTDDSFICTLSTTR